MKFMSYFIEGVMRIKNRATICFIGSGLLNDKVKILLALAK